MTAHIATGNHLDVVRELVDGKTKVVGLKPWNSDEVIPLPNPAGLLYVLKIELEREEK